MRDRRPASRSSPTTSAPPAHRPIVTLTSDFGLSDSYVAQMKAAILRENEHVRLIDVTHNVPRHDILCASITLERAIDGFPPGTVHLAVVDPGVGTDRRILIAQIRDQHIVCPDNGLITWAARLHTTPAGQSAAPPRAAKPLKTYEVTQRPSNASAVFHGRDIMAPIVARIARGEEITDFAKQITDPILLDLEPADAVSSNGQIIHIDHFGNATTNIRLSHITAIPRARIKVNRKAIGPLKRTYWDVAPGKPLALIGSSGLLEIAVRDGSARDDLKIRVGDAVLLQ